MDNPDRPRPLGLELPTGTDPVSIRKRIEAMEHLLERSLVVPGTRFPIGLDTIVGFVPVVGDIITAALAGYIVWEAKNLGLPRWKLWRMVGNIAIDSTVGSVPLIGDAFEHQEPAHRKEAPRQAPPAHAGDRGVVSSVTDAR